MLSRSQDPNPKKSRRSKSVSLTQKKKTDIMGSMFTQLILVKMAAVKKQIYTGKQTHIFIIFS